MRIGNYEGRLVIVIGELAHDVEKNSSGRFGPDPQAVYEDWDAFTNWASAYFEGSARLEGGMPVRPEGRHRPGPQSAALAR
jgi:2,4-didehydro-3-deoxy-L-rhamnonate hydrolase